MHLPPLRIGDGVAKHVEEEALGELIVFVDEGLGLFPHPIRLVQNPRNPLLLLQWRQLEPRGLFRYLNVWSPLIEVNPVTLQKVKGKSNPMLLTGLGSLISVAPADKPKSTTSSPLWITEN